MNFQAKRDIRCIGTDLAIEGLDFLRVDITLRGYIEIKRLQSIVSQAGEFATLVVQSPGWYEPFDEEGNTSEYREDGAEMIVCSKYVLIAGYEKHTDIRWECDSISIADLDNHFDVKVPA